MTLSTIDLAHVVGGKAGLGGPGLGSGSLGSGRLSGIALGGCPVVNQAGDVTFEQNGQSQKLAAGSSTIAQLGAFTVTGKSDTASGSCAPGMGYSIIGGTPAGGTTVVPFAATRR